MGGKVTKNCQGAYPLLNEKAYKANRLYWLKGRWIQLPDLLLASKWIHLVDPLLALPCMKLKIASSFFINPKVFINVI